MLTAIDGDHLSVQGWCRQDEADGAHDILDRGNPAQWAHPPALLETFLALAAALLVHPRQETPLVAAAARVFRGKVDNRAGCQFSLSPAGLCC